MVRGARAFVASWVVCLGAAVPTATPAAVVYGRAATFEWSPAQGPVEGYAVYVARNSSAFPPIPETILQGNGRRRATVTASYGDTLQVRVAAFNERDGMGPLSPSSTTVTFLAPAGQAANFGRQGSDFDGDGRSDVLFQDPATGRTVIWKINGTRLVGDSSLGALANARAEAVGDFDGDGDADVLWRRAGGSWAVAEIQRGAQVGLRDHSAPAGAKLAGSGDYDGDGMTDLLWLRPGRDLELDPAQGGNVDLGFFPDGWTIVASPDLNGDGRSDVVVRRDQDGLVYAWLMDGDRLLGHGGLGHPGPDWKVVATPDLNGDGRQDLLFRRSSDGLIYAWLVDGVQVVAHGGVSALHRTWAVVATPDLNADGRHDILLQRNDGLVYAWLMQGTRVVDHGGVALQDRRWAVVGASDPQAIGVR